MTLDVLTEHKQILFFSQKVIRSDLEALPYDISNEITLKVQNLPEWAGKALDWIFHTHSDRWKSRSWPPSYVSHGDRNLSLPFYVVSEVKRIIRTWATSQGAYVTAVEAAFDLEKRRDVFYRLWETKTFFDEEIFRNLPGFDGMWTPPKSPSMKTTMRTSSWRLDYWEFFNNKDDDKDIFMTNGSFGLSINGRR